MSVGGREDKELFWLTDEVRTPPLTRAGRQTAGQLLRMVQRGISLEFPANRPMPSIGRRVHELRFDDEQHSWRLFYRIDPTVIVVILLHEKRTQTTPHRVIVECRRRLARYDST